MLSFYKQQSYFSQIVSKKAKITILFFIKNSKNNNIILCLIEHKSIFISSIRWINWNQIHKTKKLKPQIILLFLDFFIKDIISILVFFETIWLKYQCLPKILFWVLVFSFSFWFQLMQRIDQM